VNLHYYFAGSGTHWVCKSKNVEYFDSFGLIPPNQVVKYMKTTNKNIIYNKNLRLNGHTSFEFQTRNYIT